MHDYGVPSKDAWDMTVCDYWRLWMYRNRQTDTMVRKRSMDREGADNLLDKLRDKGFDV